MDERRDICMRCFSPLPAGEADCPACGLNRDSAQVKSALPPDTLLLERYRLGVVLRANGAGFTYSAFDEQTEQRVEIKEFFPNTIAYRGSEEAVVHPAAGAELKFDDYYSEYERYTQKLIRISGVRRLPVLLDTFSTNNTQYVVLEHQEGISLSEYVQARGQLDWAACERLFFPLIHSLGTMHGQNVEHLGISPDSLLITPEDKLILTHFEMQSVRRAGTDLIEDIYPGCWAIEQYSKMRICDEVTDIYGLSASILFALSGVVPAEAPQRKRDPRLMISKAVLRGLPEYVIPALANGLQVDADSRTSSFSRFSAELSAEPTVMAKIVETETVRSLPPASKRTPGSHHLPPAAWLLISFLVTVGAIVVVMGVWFKDSAFSPQNIWSSFKEPSSSATASLELPELVGKQLSDIEALIKGDKRYAFLLDVVDEKFSDTAPQGEIISQNPLSGSKVKSGSTVRVTVSRGAAKRVLPSIDGMTYEKAAEALTAEGFLPVRVLEESEEVEEGMVIGYKEHEAEQELVYGAVIPVRVSGIPEEDGE